MKVEQLPGGGFGGTCEVNVVVVIEDPGTGEKGVRLAWDGVSQHKGRTTRELSGLLYKQLGKDLLAFSVELKKRNK
jgi:hypothetical protein